ncbi:D-alanyl-D-alanine carboxypeptidase, partial [Lactobacillus sp. XV13L]|nr:D-alanyl-D-alanine carboxypeptidase [Lactobacillus sp. XV13L]
AVSGSQVGFVRQMRAQLEKWGINDAQIYTSCGLPNKSVGTDSYPGVSGNAENKMSAKDMAIVGQHLINAYPEVIKTTAIARLDFDDQKAKTPMTNFNWMLKGLSQYHPDMGVDGLKTGTTDAAGACFIGTAKHDGARLITVVMGAEHLGGSDPARFEQTARLLSYVYKNYRPVIFKANEVIMGNTRMSVHNGQERQVNIGMKENSEVWAPAGNQRLRVGLTADRVDAPVKSGQTVNSYYFEVGNSKLISLHSPEGLLLPAKALQSTPRVNFLIRFWRWLFGG